MDLAAIPYDEALKDVKERVAKSRTSFSAGMSSLPKPRREAMYALYAFCREVDDIADDSPTPEKAEEGLALWRKRIADVFQGKASDSITSALLPAIKSFNLVERDFQEIIEGMAMDAHVISAPDMKTLDLYCDRVASAVGRVSVRIFGDASEKAMQVAYHLGRALQLTNILRDLAEDAARGRLYLPRELLEKHGIASRNPAEVVRDIRIPAVCRDLADKALQHFASAHEAMDKCVSSAMRPARIMGAYYGVILKRLLQKDWQNVFERVRLPLWQKLFLAIRCW